MARQADVQYVTYPVDGNAARKVEQHTMRNNAAPVYAPRRTARKVISVEPVALCGIVFAVVMLVAMLCGLMQYQKCLQMNRQMDAYVRQLEEQNAQLSQTYHEGYDPDEVMQTALEAGMVPSAEVQQVRVMVQMPQEDEVQMSFWQTLTNFLTGIFA